MYIIGYLVGNVCDFSHTFRRLAARPKSGRRVKVKAENSVHYLCSNYSNQPATTAIHNNPTEKPLRNLPILSVESASSKAKTVR
jgi:hypothetical protein